MPNARRISVDSERKSGNRSLDRAVADLARTQHGVVARNQLVTLGFGESAIEMRLSRGRLHRVHQGIYAVGYALLTQEGRWMAAVLAGGPGAVLSHRAAAALWGIQRRAHTIEISCRRHLDRPGIRSYRVRLPSGEITVEAGIPVTTPSRTLFDLAAVVSRDQLRRAMHETEVRRLWDSLSLPDLLRRHPRRPGASALRAVMETPGGSGPRNDFEELFLALLERAGLPRPVMNQPLWVGGRFIAPDCMWREQRVIVELDGYETHRTRAAYESDRARDRLLTAHGWRVMRITWRQLETEPQAVLRDLRPILDRIS